MLASAEAFSRQIDGVTPELQASPQLCEKKDIIIAKFDQLLKKLIGDDQTLNFTGNSVLVSPIVFVVALCARACISGRWYWPLTSVFHAMVPPDSATEKAFNDAMQAWLDTESVYRLASEVRMHFD